MDGDLDLVSRVSRIFLPRFLSVAEALFPVAGILSTATGNSLTQDMPFPSSHEATRTSLAVVWYKFDALALTTLLASLFSYTVLFSPCPVSYLIRTSLKEPEFSREKKANPRDYEELVHRAMEVNKSHHL